jgi:hypothetical protein
MMKSALAAALVVGAISPAAFAGAKPGKPVQYILESAAGEPYCDGLLLTQTGTEYTGIHNSPYGGCTEGDYAGGFARSGFGADIGGDGLTVTPTTVLVTVMTEDPSGGDGFDEVFNLDIKDRSWNVYVESGPEGITWELANGGALVVENGKGRRPALNRPAFDR